MSVMVSIDTSKESDEVLTKLYRAMSPARKASLIFDACRTGQKIALAGLKSRFPQATRQQLWHLWARQHLGAALYEQAYGNTGNLSVIN